MLQAAVTQITLPYKGTFAKPVVHKPTSMLMPHLVFSEIYKSSQDAFLHKFLGGSYDNVPAFWVAMHDHPSYANHPGIHDHDWNTRMIPLELHCDGVPVTAIARKASQTAVIHSMRHGEPHRSNTMQPKQNLQPYAGTHQEKPHQNQARRFKLSHISY